MPPLYKKRTPKRDPNLENGPQLSSPSLTLQSQNLCSRILAPKGANIGALVVRMVCLGVCYTIIRTRYPKNPFLIIEAAILDKSLEACSYWLTGFFFRNLRSKLTSWDLPQLAGCPSYGIEFLSKNSVVSPGRCCQTPPGPCKTKTPKTLNQKPLIP